MEQPDGIVLDDIYGEALVKGMHARSTLSTRGGRRELYREALFAVLMYDKVWLPSRLSAVVDSLECLVSEDLASSIPRDIAATGRSWIKRLLEGMLFSSNEEPTRKDATCDVGADDFHFYRDTGRSAIGLVKEFVWAYYRWGCKRPSTWGIDDLADFGFRTEPFRGSPPWFFLHDREHRNARRQFVDEYVRRLGKNGVEP
jgi:hypothetical protein